MVVVKLVREKRWWEGEEFVFLFFFFVSLLSSLFLFCLFPSNFFFSFFFFPCFFLCFFYVFFFHSFHPPPHLLVRGVFIREKKERDLPYLYPVLPKGQRHWATIMQPSQGHTSTHLGEEEDAQCYRNDTIFSCFFFILRINSIIPVKFKCQP